MKEKNQRMRERGARETGVWAAGSNGMIYE